MQLCRTLTFSLISFLIALPAIAQLKEIDATKLPQSPAVQAAFRSAQDLERYADTWTLNWNYDIPKAQVQDKLADDLGILSKAVQSDPNNHELQLLTGLVAHFAYNVNDEAAFDPATSNLTKAAASDPADIRGDWFLGIHQCQALQVVAGMNRLPNVEAKDKNPPPDFWYDYITCASIAILPAHTLRAIDRAVADGQSPESYHQLSEIAASRYKTADLTKTINAHEAWADEILPNNRDLFTSHLCGVSFIVDVRSDIRISDVTNGACYAMASPPSEKPPAPTFLVIATTPPAGQTLDDFARSYLKDHDVSKEGNTRIVTAQGLPCPVDRCLSLDIVAPTVYSKQGGAHILLVAFERDQPRYDGLPFEKPQGPPVEKPQEKPVAFHFDYIFHRIPGKLYYLVLLDSNQQIFATSKPEFDEFLKSLVVE
ncbi:MAG TPA: hypothetical protein VGU25_13315 [Acidobacteriaceae bacterium]|nr:hypothetical protein [Acidobacteriaceae bacterium]